MAVRVFDASQVQCSCVLEIPAWGRLAFDVIKISKVGGLLKAAPALRLPKDTRYPALLKLSGGTTLAARPGLRGPPSGRRAFRRRPKWTRGSRASPPTGRPRREAATE